MIIITQPNATDEQIARVVKRVREFGLDAQISRGASRVIIGVIGPEALLREKPIASMAGVEAIVPVSKPYKLAARSLIGFSWRRPSRGRRRYCFDFRPMLGREQRADSLDRENRKKIWRKNFARRRVQAAHLPLQFSRIT